MTSEEIKAELERLDILLGNVRCPTCKRVGDPSISPSSDPPGTPPGPDVTSSDIRDQKFLKNADPNFDHKKNSCDRCLEFTDDNLRDLREVLAEPDDEEDTD